MRACSYIVATDLGLASNPFWGVCTLAVCTPNHMGVKLEKDDWIFGFLTKKRANKMLFGMKLSCVIGFYEYFNDPKYELKRPKTRGSWKERCGDNFYYKNDTGKWQQAETIYHLGMTEKDTKYPKVFVSDYFYYFGTNAIDVPCSYQSIIPQRQGVKCNHNNDILLKFIEWLETSYEVGLHGDPIDNKDKNNISITTDFTRSRQTASVR